MSEETYMIITFLSALIAAGALIYAGLSMRKMRKRVARLQKDLEKSLGSLSLENARLADDIEETRRDILESRQDMVQSVQRGFEQQAKLQEDRYARDDARSEALRSTVEKQISDLRAENAAQLEQMRRTVDEKLQQSLDERLGRSFASVRESLDQVYKGLGEMQGLAQGVGDLKKVLSNVKTRGILGEIQLKAILEQILSPEQYLENAQIDPAKPERVEYAVKMPGDGTAPILLPIDAKFPADAYSRLQEASQSGDPAAVSEARRLLVYAVRKAAKDISEKYICPPYSTDFAVMFLPFEGLYAEVVELGMMEEVQRSCRVMIAGPSTMAALLNSLQMGFRTLAIQKNAGRVWKVLGTVKSEFDKFAEVLTAAQSRLDQAGKELDKLVGTRTRMIQRSLRDVQSLQYPGEEADKLPDPDREKD